jgi:integrase
VARRSRRRWGAGCVYRRGNRWYVKWRENGEQRYSARTYESRELALEALAPIIADLEAGRGGPPRTPHSVPTITELGDEWLERRGAQPSDHRNHKSDVSRWRRHIIPTIGTLKPQDVDGALLGRWVDAKTDIAAGTRRHCVNLLSGFYKDLIDYNRVPGLRLAKNPVEAMPEQSRAHLRSDHDASKTPFIERLSDVKRIYDSLAPPLNVMYAVGALAGLRPGEVRALRAENVWLARHVIHVCESVRNSRLGPPKNGKVRDVLILDSLQPILERWVSELGGTGLLFRPTTRRGGRPGKPPTYIQEHTMKRHLAAALRSCSLADVTWYEATRHTFASQWVLEGKPIGCVFRAIVNARIGAS